MSLDSKFKQRSVQLVNTLHLWFTKNFSSLTDDLDLPAHTMDYTEEFFRRLFLYLKLQESGAKTMSNLFRGKGSNTQGSCQKLEQLAQELEVDTNLERNKWLFFDFDELKQKNIVLTINKKTLGKGTIALLPRKTTLQTHYLIGDMEIYNLGKQLILNHSKETIQAVMSGGLSGKAPDGWHEAIYAYLHKKQNTNQPVTFQLVIKCREEDFHDQEILNGLKHQLELLRKYHVLNFELYVCIENHIWTAPDMMLIDRDYLIINWLKTTNRTVCKNRTQVGMVIHGANSFEILQYYKDFYENVILSSDKCIPIEEYLKQNKILIS